jgi:DNA-binding MarR family transcriptional regulator
MGKKHESTGLFAMFSMMRKLDKDIGTSYAMVILHLYGAQNCNLTDLCEATGMNLATLSRIISSLGEGPRPNNKPLGLLERSRPPTKRREISIKLTKKGNDFVRKMLELAYD